jgi:hypothetical protein
MTYRVFAPGQWAPAFERPYATGKINEMFRSPGLRVSGATRRRAGVLLALAAYCLVCCLLCLVCLLCLLCLVCLLNELMLRVQLLVANQLTHQPNTKRIDSSLVFFLWKLRPMRELWEDKTQHLLSIHFDTTQNSSEEKKQSVIPPSVFSRKTRLSYCDTPQNTIFIRTVIARSDQLTHSPPN